MLYPNCYPDLIIHRASFLNYVNAFPADAARFGIQNFAPQLLGGVPDILVAGPNVGSIHSITWGTLSKSREQSFSGSGSSLSFVSYTTP
ncbi:hypothetical protein D9758_006255 [Tetrapyrgos nigripes]|uniref:Uncharacterized protein n=1 Tax=Tetrapyrgos nigripes TaxID=182062 RepID=A0A8H5GAL9_9AGAR|nr:hypothetical protein D9758_006255 [Tetrapyrgos nigripes]